MAHIVCITGGLTGILHSSLGLVQHLRQAGHRVTYASPADLREPVTAQGIPYVQLEAWVMQLGEQPLGRWQKLVTLRQRQQRAVDALGVKNFSETMATLAPDLLLIDIEMHPHILAAVMAQLPVALLCPFLSIWKRPHLPPIHTEILPGQGWRGTWLGIEWSWLRYGWTKWKEFHQERWRRVGLDWISVLRCYARQSGYPFRLRFGFRQWLVPYPEGRLPILCLNAWELDFPHDRHPSMQYVGPLVLKMTPESPVRHQLDQWFERRQRGRALIYYGCSSLAQADNQFLQQIIEAAAQSPQWDWVIGLGGTLEPEDLGRLPSNVYALGWAPQLQILEQTDCAIIHGGINSINECISCGVPMLVYPLGCADQGGNGARVAGHGLGIVGDRTTHNPAWIREQIQTLLLDLTYGVRVNQMRDCFRSYGETNRAVEVVETLLSRHQPMASCLTGVSSP